MKNLPNNIKKIILKLTNEKAINKLLHSSNIFLVGGFVRDSYLYKTPKDVDIVVEGLSLDEIKNIIKNYGKIDIVGESFSVIKFKPYGWKDDIDIAIPRIDKKIMSGHKGFKIISHKGISIKEDLKRRDLTINSFCVNIESGNIIDPFNGLRDLKNGILRATDNISFIEDPLRILRTIGFATRFGFDIENETLKMMKDNADLIKQITGERLLIEFDKIINKGNTQLGLELLHKTDVDKALFDKKMLKYDKGFEYLDAVSFYYVLALLGDVDPYSFYMKKLKGKLEVGNSIKILDNIITKWYEASESERKYLVMNAITKIPKLDDIALIPPEADDIILKMRTNQIPMAKSDVPVSGEDVMELFNIPPSAEESVAPQTPAITNIGIHAICMRKL